jgi:hypothetical protein
MTRVQSELHNRLAGQIIASIVKSPLEAGGSTTNVLILLESVIVGTVLACTKLGDGEIVLDTVVNRAKARLAAIRRRRNDALERAVGAPLSNFQKVGE